MIKRMTSCIGTALHVTAACKEVCFGQNCSSAYFSALACIQGGMDHNQIQALRHLIPPVHSSSLHAGRARHRTAQNGHSSICKLTVFGQGVRFLVFAEIAVTQYWPSSGKPSYSWASPSSFADVGSGFRVFVNAVSSTRIFPGLCACLQLAEGAKVTKV